MTTMGRPRRTTIARTALAATLVVAIVLIVLFALKYIRDRNLQSLSEVESYFVAQTSEPAHGPSLFIQLAGVCDEGNKGIEVLAPQMSRGITHALVPSLFGYRRAQMSPASRKTMIVSWPGFSSDLMHTPIRGLDASASTLRSPAKMFSAIGLSAGFQEALRSENVRPVIAMAEGLMYFSRDNPISHEDLRRSADTQAAIVKLLDHFGGSVIYAECHRNGSGLYYLEYIPPGG